MEALIQDALKLCGKSFSLEVSETGSKRKSKLFSVMFSEYVSQPTNGGGVTRYLSQKTLFEGRSLSAVANYLAGYLQENFGDFWETESWSHVKKMFDSLLDAIADWEPKNLKEKGCKLAQTVISPAYGEVWHKFERNVRKIDNGVGEAIVLHSKIKVRYDESKNAWFYIGLLN